MQALRTILPAALVVLGGCGVDIDFWDEREFDVLVPAGSEARFEDHIDVDLTEHAQFKEQLSGLQKVEVVEIWLEVPSVAEGNATTKVSGRIEVSPLEDGAEKQLVADWKDLPIGVGGKVKLEWDADGYAKLEELAFETPHRFRIFVSGSLDEVPADFRLKARLHVVATVGL